MSKTNKTLWQLLVASGTAALLGTTPAQAADPASNFPNKPIRIVVPFGAGGAGDQLARAMAISVTEQSGQPVVVENRVGANGSIGSAAVAQAPADGYTVLLATNTTHAANPYLMKQLPYNPAKDFAPVTAVSRGDQVLLLHPSMPAQSVAELIALAKKSPGTISYGSGSSSSRVATEMFANATGTQLLHVPYKSNSLAVADLLAGHVKMMFTDTATGVPHLQSGKLRALAVTGLERAVDFPSVPTLREAGVAAHEAVPWWNAIYAPAATPPAVVAKLNTLFVNAARSPAAAGFYKNAGAQLFTSTPEELSRFQLAEAAKWKKAIETAGILPE